METESITIEPQCLTIRNTRKGYELRLHTMEVEEEGTGSVFYLGAWHLGLSDDSAEASVLRDSTRALSDVLGGFGYSGIDDMPALAAWLSRFPSVAATALAALVADDETVRSVEEWFCSKWGSAEEEMANIMPGFFPASLPFPSPLECRRDKWRYRWDDEAGDWALSGCVRGVLDDDVIASITASLDTSIS